MVSNVAKPASFNALAKVIGVKNATTTKKYLDCLQDTYMLFMVNKFDFSVKKQVQNPKKTYFIDNALVHTLGFNFSENTGRLLENMVFLELKRLNKDIFYHHAKKEGDFVIREGLYITEAIQVCQSVSNEETKQREINGLLEAMDTYSLKKGLIITAHTDGEIKVNKKTIQLQTAWKWLLDKKIK